MMEKKLDDRKTSSSLDDETLRIRLEKVWPEGSIPPVCASTRDFLLAKLSKLEKASAASKACPNKPETPQFRSPSTTEETRGEDNVESAFQTLVFLDLEGTGLARANPRTRMTELSMVAVGMQMLAKLEKDLTERRRESEQASNPLRASDLPEVVECPRVVNKLNMCFYPNARVPFDVANMTGLDNFNLDQEASFDRAGAATVRHFLRHLRHPVCLVAHNGFNYDFPLLLAEMAAATRDGGDEGNSWDSEVMCVDSLVAMRRIFNGEGVKGDFSAAEDQAAERQLDHDVTPAGDYSDFADLGVTPIDWTTSQATPEKRSHKEEGGLNELDTVTRFPLPVTPPASASKKSRMDCEEAQVDAGAAGAVGKGGVVRGRVKPTFRGFPNHKKDAVAVAVAAEIDFDPFVESSTSSDPREENECTPDKQGIPPRLREPPQAPRRPVRSQALGRQAGEGGGVSQNASNREKVVRARKRLDFNHPRSFSLPELHKHLVGFSPRASHSAEHDCLSLMRVCAVRRREFLRHVSDHSRPLSECKKMW